MNNITGQQLWFVLKLPNGFIPSVAKPKQIFLHSSPNLGNSWSIFFHCIESAGRFLTSLGFANKRLSLGTIGGYHTTFKSRSFLLYLTIIFTVSFLLVLWWPTLWTFFISSNYFVYNIQSIGHACILLYSIPIGQRIFLAL